MKVIIVGGGLSGLTTAIALRKYVQHEGNVHLDLTIYERADQYDNSHGDKEDQRRRKLGAGIGLQSNGLRVLEDLDPKLRDKVYASGFPCDHFKWKTSGDTLISREYVDVLPISRPFLVDRLMDHLPAGIVRYKTITKVVTREGRRPVIEFEDGSSDESADLVVGADGIRSVARQGLFGDDFKYQPQYLGICGVGGVLEVGLPQDLIDDPSMIFFVGSTGVFGYSGLTQSNKNKLLYWSVYETDLPERGHKLDHDLLLRQLRERHGGWSDPIIGKCLQKSELDNIYPIFVMPQLPHWGRDGCVLVGDAAHALPPRSGQGSSQGFEDGQTLALLLAAYLEKHDVDEAVRKSVTGLYNVRQSRVDNIRQKALMWKDPKMPMSWWKTYMLYAALFVFVNVQYLMSFLESVDGWDVKAETGKYLDGNC